MESPRSMAQWEQLSEGNVVALQRLEALSATFRSNALQMRFGTEPTGAGFTALQLVALQALDASRLFWGATAANQLEHVDLLHEIELGLRQVETRLVEHEAIRAYQLQSARTNESDVTESTSIPEDGGLQARAWAAAEKILNGPDAPARGHGWRTAVARRVAGELQADLETIRRYIRTGLHDWEDQNPDR